MSARFDLKSRLSVSTIRNSILPVFLTALLACAPSLAEKAEKAEKPDISQALTSQVTKTCEVSLSELTSPVESERFQALEKVKDKAHLISVKDIETALTALRRKNVSALIFALMEAKNEALYHLNPQARRSVETSEGSFPNIAYYYARIVPSKGFNMLTRLYEERPDQRLFICKAVGEIKTSEAVNFLMQKAKDEKTNRVPMLAGLKISGKAIDKADILWFLDQNLDREELILLSQLKADFKQSDMISLYMSGRKAFAIEYIFRDPSANFEAMKFVIESELKNGRNDTARMLLMSDKVIQSNDPKVKEYRESVMARINN